MATSDPLTGATIYDQNDQALGGQQLGDVVTDLRPFVHPRFASTAARDTAFASFVAAGGTIANGMECYTSDAGGGTWTRVGGAWVLTRPTVPPRFRGRRVNNQSIPDSTETTVTWTAEDYDTASGHASSGTTYVIPITGWYQLQATAGFLPNVTGLRAVFLRVDGANLQGTQTRAVVSSSIYETIVHTPSRRVYLTAGQTVDVRVNQTSGGALDLIGTTGSVASTFEVMWDGAN